MSSFWLSFSFALHPVILKRTSTTHWFALAFALLPWKGRSRLWLALLRCPGPSTVLSSGSHCSAGLNKVSVSF
jgi:hypothetical protein